MTTNNTNNTRNRNNTTSRIKGNDWTAVVKTLKKIVDNNTGLTTEVELFGAPQSTQSTKPLALLIKYGVVKQNDTAWCWDKMWDPKYKKMANRMRGLLVRVNGQEYIFNVRREIEKARMNAFLYTMLYNHMAEAEKNRRIEQATQAQLVAALDQKANEVSDDEIPF